MTSWSELAELTHKTQVEQFGFCICEDTEPHEHPYEDCPKGQTMGYEPPLEDDIALGKDEEEIEDDELDRMLGDE